MEPKAFEIYRHFKGNLYQVITLAEEEGTGSRLVIYQGLYAPFKVYARPLSAFMERLDRMKYPDAVQEYRFERVTEIKAVIEPSMEYHQEKSAADMRTEGVLESKDFTVSVEGISGGFSKDFSKDISGLVIEEDSTEKVFTKEVSKEEISAGESVPNMQEADMPEQAGGVNPDLLLFLDAREPEEKLDALFRIQSRLTPDMMTVMEMSQGMEPQETWTIDERYKHIKNNIITKQKYEQKRI